MTLQEAPGKHRNTSELVICYIQHQHGLGIGIEQANHASGMSSLLLQGLTRCFTLQAGRTTIQVIVHKMSEMTPTTSSSDGRASSVKVDDMTYSGEVPMSPAQQTRALQWVRMQDVERGGTEVLLAVICRAQGATCQCPLLAFLHFTATTDKEKA